jgi:hypothetical protein
MRDLSSDIASHRSAASHGDAGARLDGAPPSGVPFSPIARAREEGGGRLVALRRMDGRWKVDPQGRVDGLPLDLKSRDHQIFNPTGVCRASDGARKYT